MKHAVVWNAHAGRAAQLDAASVARRLGDDVLVLDVCADANADACARSALAQGADIVIAAGGDGTVSGVAAALVGTPAALAVLPIGTSTRLPLRSAFQPISTARSRCCPPASACSSMPRACTTPTARARWCCTAWSAFTPR